MRDRHLDLEELRPTGEASHIPDTRLDDGCEGAPAATRRDERWRLPAAAFVFLDEFSTVDSYQRRQRTLPS